MTTTGEVREVSEMSPDPRVRVFRRTLNGLDDFESLEVDAYLIVGERYAVVLDTLLCPADMAAVMLASKSAIGDRQILCVNSHADWDHTWGNGYFSNERSVPILAHEHCRRRIHAGMARRHLENYQARYPVFRDVRLLPPTLTFSERLTIADNDLTIELLHAPGHCSDQIVAWLPEISLLLAFDAVEKPLPYVEDAESMFATLERLQALKAQHVLCSHGKTTSPALIEENLAYLKEIKRRATLVLERIGSRERDDPTPLSEIIHYPFDEVIAHMTEEIDRTYYGQAHEQNVSAIVYWLLFE